MDTLFALWSQNIWNGGSEKRSQTLQKKQILGPGLTSQRQQLASVSNVYISLCKVWLRVSVLGGHGQSKSYYLVSRQCFRIFPQSGSCKLGRILKGCLQIGTESGSHLKYHYWTRNRNTYMVHSISVMSKKQKNIFKGGEPKGEENKLGCQLRLSFRQSLY